MYAAECLTMARQRERLKQAQDERPARQVAELRKLERRQRRAEQARLSARQRVDRLRSMLEAVS